MKLKKERDKIERINKARSWFFGKTNKIDKSLVKLMMKKKSKGINSINNEKYM